MIYQKMITLRAEDFTKEDFQKLRELFRVSDTTQAFTFLTPTTIQRQRRENEHEITYKNETDIWKTAVKELSRAFPNSFVNQSLEFVIDKKSRVYFRLEDCETELDIKCKVLEWLSRTASKGIIYRRDKLNTEYQDKIRGYINDYLRATFTREDMDEIYTRLGNSCNHTLTIAFINSGYNMDVLRERENNEYDTPEL